MIVVAGQAVDGLWRDAFVGEDSSDTEGRIFLLYEGIRLTFLPYHLADGGPGQGAAQVLFMTCTTTFISANAVATQCQCLDDLRHSLN